MRRRLRHLLILLACAASAAPAAAQSRQMDVPEGMRYAASVRGTTYYAVTCAAWRSLKPANLRFFRTVEEAEAARLRPSVQPGCAGADTDAGPARTTDATTCTVARVIDGDTLACDDGTRVRLLLIGAPELSQGAFGDAARAALDAIAPPGTVLTLERDVQHRDRYARTLAYLWLADGRMVNEEMLRAGMAVVSVYPPNVQHVDRLRAALRQAQQQQIGLWATSAFECSPAGPSCRAVLKVAPDVPAGDQE